MQKLIMYLSSKDTPPLYAMSDNSPLPDDLQAAIKDKPVIVIVPGEDVLLTHVALPKLSKSRLMQALPFALEEQLIAEVDTLHFAPLLKNDGEYAVAVIAKEKMQDWVQQLKAWQLKPEKLIPSFLTLSVVPDCWQIVVHDNTTIVRTFEYQGFACDRQNLRELLNLLIATRDTLPQEITIRNYTATTLAPELQLAIHTNEIQFPSEQFMQDLAQGQKDFADINLLQGDYSFKQGKRAPVKNMVYLSVFMTSIWLLLLFMYPSVSYFLLRQKLQHVNMQISEIYRHNFPHSTSMVAPKIRMEEQLHKVAGKNNQSQLLTLLSNLSYALAESANISLTRFEYQNNQLNVEINAGSTDDVTAFTNRAANKGLAVKQQNATLNGSRVNATVVLE